MNFQYQAKDRKGERTTGSIDAESLAAARAQLREQGLFVLALQPGLLLSVPQVHRARLTKRRVGKNDVLMVTYQLAIMLQSGVDLSEAVRGSAEHCQNASLKTVLEAIHEDVTSGQPMSEAMRKHVHVFGEAYVASISAAEASGTMADVLKRLAELTQNEIRLRNTIVGVITYPAILFSLAIAVGIALVGFVLPQFATVFENLGNPPPPLTQFLIGGASWIRHHLLIVGGVAVGCLLVLWQVYHSGWLKRVGDRFVLTGPIISKAAQALFIGRAFRLLGNMLESGVPLLDAIRLCRKAVPNQLYYVMFETLEQDVINGKGITDTLARTPFIPPGATQMVATAERSGKLGQVLQTVGQFYEDDGERLARQLAKLIEPAVIVTMGGVVSVVVAAIMLPLLDLSTIPQ
ncbi:MAG: type II secretion system F family protein [Planctomycetaceae bacterium]|nr:type II secretion system F family protein [Planctomycetaceae bacterium]